MHYPYEWCCSLVADCPTRAYHCQCMHVYYTTLCVLLFCLCDLGIHEEAASLSSCGAAAIVPAAAPRSIIVAAVPRPVVPPRLVWSNRAHDVYFFFHSQDHGFVVLSVRAYFAAFAGWSPSCWPWPCAFSNSSYCSARDHPTANSWWR